MLQAAIKQELNSISSQIYQIDLQIQNFRQQGNQKVMPCLKAAKLELQKKVVNLQIQLKKAVNKKKHN